MLVAVIVVSLSDTNTTLPSFMKPLLIDKGMNDLKLLGSAFSPFHNDKKSDGS
jgi:hypothetical protein